MELIDKSDIMSRIEEVIKEYSQVRKVHPDCEYYDGVVDILEELRNEFLDTLETKKVDLEKEIDGLWNPRFNLGWDEKSLLSVDHEGFSHIAKYFFELGLKTKTE